MMNNKLFKQFPNNSYNESHLSRAEKLHLVPFSQIAATEEVNNGDNNDNRASFKPLDSYT